MIALLAVIAAGTLMLAVAAVAHGQPDPPASTPTYSPRAPTPAPTATPTATSSASPLALPPLTRAQERFLLVDDIGTLWRAVAGSCTSGEPAMIERSADGGATWVDVTPGYLGINQVTALLPLTSGEAQLVASTDATCAAQGLRTYTQGEFWEQYSETLTDASYLPPAGPSTPVTPIGAPPAPCSEPTSLSVDTDAAALLCDSQPYLWTPTLGASWLPVTTGPARAVLLSGGTITIAHGSSDCAGVAISTAPVTGAADLVTSCRPDLAADAASVLAADPAGSVLLWSGDTLLRL
jgi:hypothetical protein